jgi:hypothetical protein
MLMRSAEPCDAHERFWWVGGSTSLPAAECAMIHITLARLAGRRSVSRGNVAS